MLNKIKKLINDLSNKQTTKPKRGDEINQFYFIGKTKKGCPKLEFRKIGDKGIKFIEVTNTGNSFEEDKHLTKVRVTGLKEDNKTEYTLYFKDVYTECSKALLKKFDVMTDEYLRRLKAKIKNLQSTLNKHQALINNSYETIYKKVIRYKKNATK